MDLFLAISQGIGTSLATGIRALLVPLFVGVMARLNVGIDFERTGFEWLEAVWWLALLAALVVAAWLVDRSDIDVPEGVWAVVAMGLGGMLFAGALEDENYFGEAGIVPGMACALLGFLAARAFLGGAVDRLAARGESGGTINALGDVAALAVAALAVLLPPVSLAAVAFCLWVLLARRQRAGQKYEGLRILR
ncbi:MAG TPA: DUF4126 family protein [Solirubrobacterales bacterium]|nr:DUF4126 family protein [Solirubrobacterales bacterium]